MKHKRELIFGLLLLLFVTSPSIKMVRGATFSESLTSGMVIEWEIEYYRFDGVKVTEPTSAFKFFEGATIRVEILKDLGNTELNTVQEFDEAIRMTVSGELINFTSSMVTAFQYYFIFPNMEGSVNIFEEAVINYNPVFYPAENPYVGKEEGIYIEHIGYYQIDFHFEYHIDTGIMEFRKEIYIDNWVQFNRVEVTQDDNNGFFSNLDYSMSWLLFSIPLMIAVRIKNLERSKNHRKY